jgi:hypothetical protein
MQTILKRFVVGTALALSLIAGSSMPAFAQCYTVEPLYGTQNGQLVRIGWLAVPVACPTPAPKPTL